MRLWSFDRWTADTPIARHARAAVRDGFAIVFLRPGGKEPLCPLTARERKKAGPNHPCGVAHASTDERWVVRKAKQLEESYGRINVGVAAHASGVVVIDADTPEQVESVADLLRQLGEDAALLANQPTVRTPGSQRDGVWVHEQGTHWYFNRPADLDLPEYPGEMSLAGGAVMRWGNSYTLVPPSVRAEGQYISLAEYISDVPVGLAALAREHVATKLQIAADLLSRYHDDRIIEWSLRTPWHTLLEPDGWSFTGKLDRQCDCPVWKRPGEDTSTDRSAIAHNDDCTRLPNVEGHGALHLFTDNPPGLLADAVARGQRTFTKLQYVALTRYDGDELAAKIGEGIEPDPSVIADWLDPPETGNRDDRDDRDDVGGHESSRPGPGETRDDRHDRDDDSSRSSDPSEEPADPSAARLKKMVDDRFLQKVVEDEATVRYEAYKQRKTKRPPLIEGWTPDLEAFVEAFFADAEEPGPVILLRTDMVALLYEARVNGLVGRRGAGKTWLALLATKQVLEAGGTVLYVDMEDKRRAWAGRLRQIGCDIDKYVRERKVVWMKPGDLPDDMTPFVEMVGGRFTLVVFDVMNRLISRRGGNVNDGNAESVWLYNNLFDPLADAGSTVLVLDHPNKKGQRADADIEDLNPAGGAMRMNNASGHVIAMRVVRPFSRDRITKATAELRPLVELLCLKDRSGLFEEGAVVGLMQGDMALWGLQLTIGAPGPAPTQGETMAEEVRSVGQKLLMKLRAAKEAAGVDLGMTEAQMVRATTESKRWMVPSAIEGLRKEQLLNLDDDGKYRLKEES